MPSVSPSHAVNPAPISLIVHNALGLISYTSSNRSATPRGIYRHLVSLLSDKWSKTYTTVMGWLHCCLSLLHSAISFCQPVLASSVNWTELSRIVIMLVCMS